MLGPAVDAVLPALRAQAESMMTDTCTIDRITIEWVGGVKQTVVTTVAADVPCALDDPEASGSEVVAGESATRVDPLVKVPVTVEGVQPDDRVTLASGPVVWVTDAPVRTHQVQRRLKCRWVK